MAGLDEVQESKVGKIYGEKETRARQYHVPARPERILPDIGRKWDTRRGDARNGQIRGFLGWYIREKRTNTLYAMDRGNMKTTSSKGKQCQ